MHTDELLEDPELDRALRDLLPPMPRSRAWERAQRDELMAFISSGAVRPTALSERRRATFASDVQVDSDGARPTRPIKALLVAAAGVAVIVVSVALNSGSTEPVQGPESTIRSPLAVETLRPDRFPLVPVDDPRAAEASAEYGGQLSWENSPKSEALVARIDGDTMTGAIALSVSRDSFAVPFGTAGAQTVTVAGTEMQLFIEDGTPALTAVVLRGQPTFVAIGLDPIAFLEAAGGFPFTAVQVYSNEEVTFALNPLPVGYEVVVPPTRLPLGSFDASLRVPDGDAGDGISVRVEVRNPLLGVATVGDLRRVDINGVSGWMRDIGPGSTIAWPVSQTTWASIGGATTAQDALEFARSLTFVDEVTWRTRYGLEEPEYPTTTNAPVADDSTDVIALVLPAMPGVMSLSSASGLAYRLEPSIYQSRLFGSSDDPADPTRMIRVEYTESASIVVSCYSFSSPEIPTVFTASDWIDSAMPVEGSTQFSVGGGTGSYCIGPSGLLQAGWFQGTVGVDLTAGTAITPAELVAFAQSLKQVPAMESLKGRPSVDLVSDPLPAGWSVLVGDDVPFVQQISETSWVASVVGRNSGFGQLVVQSWVGVDETGLYAKQSPVYATRITIRGHDGYQFVSDASGANGPLEIQIWWIEEPGLVISVRTEDSFELDELTALIEQMTPADLAGYEAFVGPSATVTT